MKKLWKIMICLAVAASLIIGGAGMAYAADTADGAESDLSLDDLLNLLSALSGDEEGDGETAGETTVYSTGPVSFEIPSDWSVEEDENEFAFYSSDFTEYASAMYQEGSEEEIDITNEDNLNELIESMGGDEGINTIEFITVCGLPALWIDMTMEEEGLSLATNALLIQLDDALFSLAVMGIGSSGESFFDYISIVDSIAIEGADGETDYSAAFDSDSYIPVFADEDVTAASEDLITDITATESGELILIDDDAVTVSLNGFQEDDWYALTAGVYTENKTDLNLYYSFDNVSVNGYMCDPWWGTTVASGHKSNTDLHFYKDDFEQNGIGQVHDIEFTLKVRDDDDWFADPIEEQTFIVYPFGDDVSEQEPQEFDDDAILLADTDECTMILTGYSQSDYYFSANVYLENKSETDLEFQVSGSTAVNGYEINPYFYMDIPAGKKANSSINWYQGDLQENGIDTVEELELEINIQDANDWFADPVFSDTLVVSVE